MEQFFQNRIAIVGAGPSGIFCALNLLKFLKEINYSNFFIDIYDFNAPLKTILKTGNGRCNITNSTVEISEFIQNYPRGEKFLYSIFSKHSNFDTLEYLNSIGIETYIENNNRVFPKSNSAIDVRNKFLKQFKKYKNYKFINKKINSKDDLKKYNYIVISAGSRNTEKLITSFNHNLIPFKKALVGLKIKNNKFPKGVSIKSLDGDFVFTENGISGPLAFIISSKNIDKAFPYDVSINLFKFEELEQKIKENPKKSIGNILSMIIPKSFAKCILDNFDKKASEISKTELKNLTHLDLTVISTENKGEVVNSGGVDLAELDNDCKSKIRKNLWFCGEILNIDGFCGGFNLQNCWSTAFVCANNIFKNIKKTI